MNHLVLENGKNLNFEKLYMRAMLLAGMDTALQRKPSQAELKAEPRYWQRLYQKGNYKETSLVSAIIMELDLPFGAYVVVRCEDDLIELVPWLYSDQLDRAQSISEVFSEDASAGDLRAFARSLLNTADYLEWLEDFTKAVHKL